MATPDTDISRGRIVHRANSLNSIWVSASDVRPTFKTRLSDEYGAISTGGFTTAGSRLCAKFSRSCTNCRALRMSVPVSKIITTDDSPSTDFDRRVFRNGRPLSEFSNGTVTRESTSSVDSPGASVCTSTNGGANSGNTSSGAFFVALMPTNNSATAAATTSTRMFSAQVTMAFSMGFYFPVMNSVPKSSAEPSVTT